MGHYLFIIAILYVEAVPKLALLLGCRQLELQGLDPPDVVDTKHPLLHLPRNP